MVWVGSAERVDVRSVTALTRLHSDRAAAAAAVGLGAGCRWIASFGDGRRTKVIGAFQIAKSPRRVARSISSALGYEAPARYAAASEEPVLSVEPTRLSWCWTRDRWQVNVWDLSVANFVPGWFSDRDNCLNCS